MAKAFVNHQGLASFYDPESQDYFWIQPSKVQQALSDGLVPEAPEQFERRQAFKAAEENNLGAFAAGVARGATFGLSDMLLSRIMPNTDLGMLRDANPVLSGLGDAAGVVGSALIPGGLVARTSAGAARAGVAAGAQALKVTGRKSVQKIVEKASAGALEGAAFGAGKAVSDVALAPGEISGADAAAHLLESAFAGAKLGGALGAGAGVVSVGAKAVKGKLVSAQKLSELNISKRLMERELNEAVTAGAAKQRISALQKGISDANRRIQERKNELGFLLTAKTVGSVVAAGSAIATGNTSALAVAALMNPRIVNSFGKFLSPHLKRGSSTISHVIEVSPTAKNLFKRSLGATTTREAVDTSIDIVTSGSLGDVITSKTAGVALSAGEKAAATTKFARRLLRPITLFSGVSALNDEDVKSVAQEVNHLDELSLGIIENMGRQAGVDDSVLQAGLQRGIMAARYLADKSPAKTFAVNEQIPAAAVRRFREQLRAVISPEEVVQLLAKGRGRKEHIEALAAVHPEVYSLLRKTAERQLLLSAANGSGFDRDQKRTMALVLGENSDSRHTMAYQQYYQQGKEQKLKARRQRVDMANKAMARSDRIASSI